MKILSILLLATTLNASEGCSTAAIASTPHCAISIHWDPILGRRFLTITNTDHPDWSAISIPDPSTLQRTEPNLQHTAQPLLVRAGQPVKLWRRDALLQLDLTAIAEDNGYLGQQIKVRYAGPANSNQPSQEIAGVVRAQGSVEMTK
jgi:hypothetical protein